MWTHGGKQILWKSASAGYRDEVCLYDQTFQPYGQLFIMNADGSDKRRITDSIWEDSTPQYVPRILSHWPAEPKRLCYPVVK